MIGLLFLVAAFLVFVVLSVRFGVDSRPQSNDPHRSEYPIGIS